MPNQWNYFNEAEITGLETEVIAKLDAARHKAGIPFQITSTRRTPEQNTAVGGVPDSAHLKGLAADLAVPDSSVLFKMIAALLAVGFERLVIGIRLNEEGKIVYHNLHCDLDMSLPHPVIAVKRYGG